MDAEHYDLAQHMHKPVKGKRRAINDAEVKNAVSGKNYGTTDGDPAKAKAVYETPTPALRQAIDGQRADNATEPQRAAKRRRKQDFDDGRKGYGFDSGVDNPTHKQPA